MATQLEERLHFEKELGRLAARDGAAISGSMRRPHMSGLLARTAIRVCPKPTRGPARTLRYSPSYFRMERSLIHESLSGFKETTSRKPGSITIWSSR
jgi:hypothetical protein